MNITLKDIGIFLLTAIAGYLIIGFTVGFLESMFHTHVPGIMSMILYIIFVVWATHTATKKPPVK